MSCKHYWTVTSECPRCLREALDDMTRQRDAALAFLVEATKYNYLPRDSGQNVRLGNRVDAFLETSEGGPNNAER